MAETFSYPAPRVVKGTQEAFDAAYARFIAQPVDDVRLADASGWKKF